MVRIGGVAVLSALLLSGSSRVAYGDAPEARGDEPGAAKSSALVAGSSGQRSPSFVLARLDTATRIAVDAIPIDGDMTIVRFPVPTAVANRRAIRGIVSVASAGRFMFLQASSGASVGSETTLELVADGLPKLKLRVRIERVSADTSRFWLVSANAELVGAAAETPRMAGALAASGSLASFESMARVSAIELLDEYERIPIEDPNPGEQGVIVRARSWIRVDAERTRALRFYVANRSERPYRLARVQLLDHAGTEDRAKGVGLDRLPDSDGVRVLEPGETLEGWLWIDSPASLGSHAMLAVSEPKGNRPRVQRDIPVFDLRPPCGRPGFPEPCPLSPEEEERRRRALEAQRVSMHVIGSIGAIWFPAGVDGVVDSEATSFAGFGARVTKGLHPNWAVEIDLAGATSGTASFRDVNGAGNDLTRSARFGRLSFGGVLRLGGVQERVVPTLRLGVGLQLIDGDAILMTDTGPVDGPGDGIQVGGTAYGGIGIDVNLSKNLVVGFGFAFTASQRVSGILDVGVSLAYRWDATQ